MAEEMVIKRRTSYQVQQVQGVQSLWWERLALPEDLKWRIARVVADVQFQLMKELLVQGCQPVSEPTLRIQVVGQVRALDREAQLREDTLLPEHIQTVTIDITDFDPRRLP